MRGFVQAKPGNAVAYLDWSAEEIAVAAAFSGDEALITDYQTGDPYCGFAVRAGLAPKGATKKSHPEIRDLCKILFLSLNYGRAAQGLATALGKSVLDADPNAASRSGLSDFCTSGYMAWWIPRA